MSLMGRLFYKLTHEIALERYGLEYDDLPYFTQQVINEMASKRATDQYADECDIDYDRWIDKWLHSNFPIINPAEICAVPCPKCNNHGWYFIRPDDKEPCECQTLDQSPDETLPDLPF